MKLWLVRHAPLAAVPPGLCIGAADLPADAAATATVARALAAELPAGLVLQTSTLQRCEHLAQALCGLRPDLACKQDARLREADFGAWQMRQWDAIGQAALTAWTDDFWQHRPGGGESLETFMARVGAACDDTRQGGRDAVWITHAGVIRAVRLLARGVRRIDRATDWPTDAPACGQWEVLDLPPAAPHRRVR